MTVQAPIPDFAAARRAMVDSQLRPQGVTDAGVLAAMGLVPRERFLPDHSRPLAYIDRSVALGGGRLMAAPAALGALLNAMAPAPGQRALVVGAATGYSASILAAIGLDVTALECDAALAAAARDLGMTVVEGPLGAGHKAGAPYDLILIDGAVDFIPEPLVKQLAEGGRLGAALNEQGVIRVIVGRKVGGAFGHRSIGDAVMAPLPGFQRPRAFTF